ncbi:UDP-N-acetylmuramoyl-L-alanine--D-glutamate ligase [Clostridium sp. D2Q-14]|uniref:UDP-N-acetylmuramoyl-L-alanine--D-glutamate ligase n=1 Tax=Anaeromonas gelatinilytica TaxID=2683194 RepID=UPI00193C0265|nr:UDP-N-acetylmuramoyl-L-alanine--D-glutamate ligase [Anaeromonas gelatinilytica]MBS4535413.1 UDP-N-acetylmuramoyl-L-alanine--D-glutamate ligase [Anaeromonas gelatinilytica]
MNIKDKNILVLGLGISGVSTAKALNKLGANIIINDSKDEKELRRYIDELKNINIQYLLGTNDINLNNIDLIIKSPGIKNSVPIIKKAIKNDIEVITDIELGYRLFSNKFVAITGTNGKTTTTTLVGKVFKEDGKVTHVSGNIGVGILWELVNSNEEDYFIIETSSFQLENTVEFKPDVSVIINIKPDHIDWHGNYENYINAKAKIFKNQDERDYIVLNYDDADVRKLENKIKANIIWFSQNNKLEKGIFIDCNHIVYSDGVKSINIIGLKDIKIPGKHNIENIMATIGISLVMNLDINNLRKSITSFYGVEHRLEFVEEIGFVRYYNDSKGSNPAASIQAIKALEAPIVLIAGGYDKNSDYQEFVNSFNGKVSSLILLGETKYKIAQLAKEQGFENIYMVNDMEEAVNKAYTIATFGGNVLLSPASASWDMYDNYEIRGNDFKNLVKHIRRIHNAKKG